jgi:hypothetical protein
MSKKTPPTNAEPEMVQGAESLPAATEPGAAAEPPLPAEWSGEEAVVYRAMRAYWVLAALGLVATASLLFDMTRGVRWDTAFFAVVGLVGGLWALWMASTRLIVLPDGLLVQRATAQYLVDWRQLLRVEPSGRLLSVLALIYHPRRDDGIIDTDAVGSLLVPGVRNQSALLETVEQRLPA